MEKNPQQSLEELIHRELSKLPPRSAPATLIPRVMSRIEARAHRRWWMMPWSQWPSSMKVISLPPLFGVLLLSVLGLSILSNLFVKPATFEPVARLLGAAAWVLDLLSVLGNALFVIGRGVDERWLMLALCVPVSMYLACVGLGTLCYRMASQRR